MKKIKQFFSDFKAFISRGNVIDMAVGVIIGGAFSAIVTALTNKIIMPLINLLLSLAGGAGLESARTILGNPVYNTPGDVASGINWASTIYIDWGAFITAIIDFLLIAFVLFTILKVMMSAQGLWKKGIKERPTKEERKILKAEGVNMKDYREVIVKTAELRERNKPAPQPPKPTQEQLLTEILAELKKQNEEKEHEEKQA
ncbi:MAG: large conductance mechanosensitive channel protein MscL [Candidatus Caccovivens sp.]